MNPYAPPAAVPATAFVSPGERVVWSGSAPRGVRFRPEDLLLVPFSLLWGGFAFAWETGVWRVDAPLFFRQWGVPFVLVGLYLIAGRFVLEAYLRARTSYAVTDRAAYVVRVDARPTVRRYTGSALDDLIFEPAAGGAGTIRFPVAGGRSLQRNPWLRSGLDRFERIPEATTVRDLIEAARRPA